MKESKDKGLCYYCENQWSLGRKCQKPRPYILEDCETLEEFLEEWKEKKKTHKFPSMLL